MAKSKKSNNKAKVVGVAGVGLAALAAAAAGAYFLYGSKEGAKRRKKISGWMLKAKGEVLEQMEKVEHMNEKAYRQMVDTVAVKYKKLKHVDPAELQQMVKELKGHWKGIQKELVAAQKGLQKKAAPKRKSAPKRRAAPKKKAVAKRKPAKRSAKKRTAKRK